MKKYLFLITIILPMLSCKAKKELAKTDNVAQPLEIISLSKSGCFGTCPVYTLSIFTDLNMVFNGKKYTSKLGLHEKVLDESTFAELISDFRTSNFMDLDEDYPTNISDIPATTITYNSGHSIKSVKTRSNGPDSFNKLQTKLEALANTLDWTDMTSSDEAEENENQIIIQFKEVINPDEWSQQFEEYDFKITKRLSPKLQYWLATFDPAKINRNQMLQLVLEHQDVKVAEFNKKVSIR